MRYALVLLMLLSCYRVGLTQGYQVETKEKFTYSAAKVRLLRINVERAYVTVSQTSGKVVEVNVTKRTSHSSSKEIVEQEKDWLKYYVTNPESELLITNIIELPYGVKDKPKARHATYIDIKLPSIYQLDISINIGSLSLENINAKAAISTVFCKSKLDKCTLNGKFTQRLGDIDIIASKLSVDFDIDNVVMKADGLVGTVNLTAQNTKLRLEGELKNINIKGELKKCELNYYASKTGILDLDFVRHNTEMKLPDYLPKPSNKTAYKIKTKNNRGTLALKIDNSFINIYKNQE